MRTTTLAGLQVNLTGGPDRQGGGDGPVVVLLHGFGAPGDDLVPLWDSLDISESVRGIFPAAPLSLPPPYGNGRAWWMLDMEQLARDRAEGRDRDIRIVPNGLVQARQHMTNFLQALEDMFQVSPDQIIVGGFSQGAMLACDAALRSSRPYAGLILLSTTFIAADEWLSLMPHRKGLPVFQSHGKDDPILPYRTALQLRDALQINGLKVEWHGFEGGHEIPYPLLNSLGLFIHNIWNPQDPAFS